LCLAKEKLAGITALHTSIAIDPEGYEIERSANAGTYLTKLSNEVQNFTAGK
jgi:hypothetical protein